MPAGTPDLSIVVPVYNEEGIVASACLELMAALDARGWNYELLLTENGSRDRTVAILEELARAHPRLRHLHSPEPNYGQALRRGILEARGRFVVADEIDLCDPGFYDRALPILARGEADMVVGSKRAAGSVDGRPAFRRLATWVHNTVLRIVLGFRGTDTHGVKAFSREASPRGLPLRGRPGRLRERARPARRHGREAGSSRSPSSSTRSAPPPSACCGGSPTSCGRSSRLFWVLRVSAPVRAGPGPGRRSAPRA